MQENDSKRKQDHLSLTEKSKVHKSELDRRFMYEPMLAAHPKNQDIAICFLQKKLHTPIWVSSMTGGTAEAKLINHNLARVCADFKMGMGLGSCRSLLEDNRYIEDFDVRRLMGDDLPLYANLGIAQVEQLVSEKHWYKINTLVKRLSADGLIIHVNPLQEWSQVEGDRINVAPIDIIENLLLHIHDIPIIVKEVGQGMGYNSLKSLMKMPLAAIEFGAAGGTNFTKLELLRNSNDRQNQFNNLSMIGHSAEEMVDFVNQIVEELGNDLACKEVIISGGIKNFLDGYYLTKKIKLNAIYGQASSLLFHAQKSYDSLYNFIAQQKEGLLLAQSYLRVRE